MLIFTRSTWISDCLRLAHSSVAIVVMAAVIAIQVHSAEPDPNPPAPVLVSLAADHKHVDLTWSSSEDPEAFQVQRRVNGKVEQAFKVGLHRCKIQYDGPVTLYLWTDKKVNPGVEYSYTVAVFTATGTSLESNALTITPKR